MLICVKAEFFEGCGRKWPKPLNFVQHVENPKWVETYIESSTEANCSHFYGLFNFTRDTYRFIVVYNGPVSIMINRAQTFRSFESITENGMIQLRHFVDGPTKISITGDILLFDWKPLTLKIYLYSLPSAFNSDLEKDPKCWESMFSAEPRLFHSLLQDADTVTSNPLEADYFYVPVHTTCKKFVKWLGPDIKVAPMLLHNASRHIKENFPFWSRRFGRDHIFTHLHDFGPCYAWRQPENERKRFDGEIQNAMGLLYGGDYATKCYRPDHDIILPPFVDDDRLAFEPAKKWLGFFEGTVTWKDWRHNTVEDYSRGVRKKIADLYENSTSIHIIEGGSDKYAERMRMSTFALCPLGFAAWSPRIIQALIYNAIPVIISDTIALPFEPLIDWSRFSIRVSEKVAQSPNKLYEILNAMSAKRIHKLQHFGRLVRARFIYHSTTTRYGATPMQSVYGTLKEVLWKKIQTRPF